MLEHDFRKGLLERLDTHFKSTGKPRVLMAPEGITGLLGVEASKDNLRAVRFALKRLLAQGYLDAKESDAAGGPVFVFDLTSAGRAAVEAPADLANARGSSISRDT